jgi:hypothetical protein
MKGEKGHNIPRMFYFGCFYTDRGGGIGIKKTDYFFSNQLLKLSVRIGFIPFQMCPKHLVLLQTDAQI